MDTTQFLADIEQIPARLLALADELERGIGALDELPTAGIARILVLGMGSSFSAADVIAREARAAGLSVTAELASGSVLPPAASDLLVIAVSATGGSVELLDACEPYRGTGRLVALTNRAESRLAELADVVVPMHAGVEASGVACRTFRHTIVMLRAVLERYGVAPPSPLPGIARRAAAANQALLDSRGVWLDPVADTLASPLGTWVLAPVERQASARQAALMMREVPRRIAYASETGDWSHVDVYLTKVQDYRALVYAGSKWDGPALKWMEQRASTFVAVGVGIDGAPLPGAAQTVRYRGENETAVAQLTEVLVGELCAAHWHG